MVLFYVRVMSVFLRIMSYVMEDTRKLYYTESNSGLEVKA